MGHIAVAMAGQRGYFEQWFATRYGDARRVEVVASTFEAACRYVVGTDRIATVFTRLARLCAKQIPLRIFRAPFPVPEITEAIEWNPYQDDDPGNLWFRGILKQIAQSSPFSRKNGSPQ